MTYRRSAPAIAWIGIATAALLLGHWAAYLLAYREIHLRDVVLAQTGHGYLAPAGKLALVLFLVALGWWAARACTSKAPPARIGAIALRLAAIQLAGYTALEVVERMVVRAPVLEMFGHYTYALGLVMQVVTALGGALIVLLLTRTARRVYLLITAPRPRPRTASGSPRPCHRKWTPSRPGLIGAIGVRGPPQPALA